MGHESRFIVAWPRRSHSRSSRVIGTIAVIDKVIRGWLVTFHFCLEGVSVECRELGTAFTRSECLDVLGMPSDDLLTQVLTMGNALLAKASGGTAVAPGSRAGLPQAFAAKYPIVSAFMTEDVDADDRPRERSKVTVFDDEGVLKAVLSDPSRECSLYVTLTDPTKAYDALERAMAKDEVEWRKWGGTKKAKSGKRT